MSIVTPPSHAELAYEAIAPFYDDFTAHHNDTEWTAALERLARSHGLRGVRLLDVACGTGKSFMPFLERGWRVVGTDVSPAMLARAQAKAGGRVELVAADMRALGALGRFDLVCCLDDALNYLDEPEDLVEAFRSARRNLADGGRYLFDLNTLVAYRTFFSETSVREGDGVVMLWRGHGDGSAEPGARASATFEAFEDDGDGRWLRHRSVHRQRHHPRAVVEAALREAGLECLGAFGQGFEGRPTPGVDEDVDTKVVYLAAAR